MAPNQNNNAASPSVLCDWVTATIGRTGRFWDLPNPATLGSGCNSGFNAKWRGSLVSRTICGGYETGGAILLH